MHRPAGGRLRRKGSNVAPIGAAMPRRLVAAELRRNCRYYLIMAYLV